MDESTGVFTRVCARMCVCVWAASLFFYCWVIFPNDEGGAPYMEMGILLFYFASSCRYGGGEGGGGVITTTTTSSSLMKYGWMDDDPRIDWLIDCCCSYS